MVALSEIPHSLKVFQKAKNIFVLTPYFFQSLHNNIANLSDMPVIIEYMREPWQVGLGPLSF